MRRNCHFGIALSAIRRLSQKRIGIRNGFPGEMACSGGEFEARLQSEARFPSRFTVVDSTSNRELINTAQGVLNPHTVGGRLFGNVASVLITATGNRFSGVCIDTGSGTGFCAEHSAIAAMVTAGEYQIAKIVAVWRDGDGLLYVLPPCGRCREFIRQVDPANLDTEVILGSDRSALLRELLPANEWPEPLASD
jgi:cytidine deaminase